jgi:GMP synthase-like glutamine amidotransferase
MALSKYFFTIYKYMQDADRPCKGKIMHIAILMTNTDESTFSQDHPKDGEKFTSLMQLARPDWRYSVHSVKDGAFPDSLEGIDGVLITGSPASVHDGLDWITRLEALIREIVAARLPVYGACFGHQVIATALGGEVGYNPGGYIMGTVHTQLEDEAAPVAAYAAHKEQVTRLPQGARVVAISPACPVAGFAIGNGVRTTQYHPEMTPDFIAALTDEMADELGADRVQDIKASLALQPDMPAWAARIAEFLERGNIARAPL